MKFSSRVELAAIRSAGGEHAWRRAEALEAARELAAAGCAILGGELWVVREARIQGLVPMKSGQAAVMHWETDRREGEPWGEFVQRSLADTIAGIENLPAGDDAELPVGAHIYYNLTWSHVEMG